MDRPSAETWPGHTGNWGRWPNDRGTLNLITPEVVQGAVATVRQGRVINCARPLAEIEPVRGTRCVEHKMIAAGVWDLEPERTESLNASDWVSYRVHGMVNTHLDALAHVGYAGRGFNGHAFSDMVTMDEGVKIGDIADMVGIVTRGVLIDVPRMRGIAHLEPGDFVRPEEVEAAAHRLRPGDAAIIRTGATLAPGHGPRGEGNRHGTWTGLHPECVEVLGRLDIGVLASDSSNDVFPSPYEHICRSPVHTLSLAYWGIPLLHNMDLEELADACATEGRDSFLFMVSPLRMARATGSLVSPVAVL